MARSGAPRRRSKSERRSSARPKTAACPSTARARPDDVRSEGAGENKANEIMADRNGWGLVGTGRIADDRILPGINAFEGNDLIAVVSRDQAKADAVAKKFGAKHAYTSFE